MKNIKIWITIANTTMYPNNNLPEWVHKVCYLLCCAQYDALNNGIKTDRFVMYILDIILSKDMKDEINGNLGKEPKKDARKICRENGINLEEFADIWMKCKAMHIPDSLIYYVRKIAGFSPNPKRMRYE